MRLSTDSLRVVELYAVVLKVAFTLKAPWGEDWERTGKLGRGRDVRAEGEPDPGLSVVRETVDRHAVCGRLGRQWGDVNREERSTENGALRYAEADVCSVWHCAADRHGLGSPPKVIWEPAQHRTSQTAGLVEEVKENVVVDGLEGGRQIEEDECCAMATSAARSMSFRRPRRAVSVE